MAHGPACLGLLRPELLAMTDRFAGALHRHQEHEELVVFPLVRKHVPGEIQTRILAVMSRREAGP